ncbi:MAG: threonine ammonia-lyase [Candidatus Zhuqueibacterota bacterium]
MTHYSEHTIATKTAYNRIAKYVRHTPMEICRSLSRLSGGTVYMKMEHWQHTGSFKVRGALSRMMTLSEAAREKGIITASAGNHGLGVAYASEILGIRSRIVLPVTASPTKLRLLKFYGVEIVQAGEDYDEAEDIAHRIEADCGLTFVHAFDDAKIIAGQGTLALEVLKDLPDPDIFLVPLGGGGLISGMAITLKKYCPHAKVIGIQSTASPAVYRALQANQVIETPIDETIADGLAGRLVSPKIFETIQKYVDDVILVDEKDIVLAILYLLQQQHTLIEGAAAVGVAALLSHKISITNKKCVVLLTGRNIDVSTVKTVMNHKFEI